MPLIKSAKKKIKQDKKKRSVNLTYKKKYKESLKKAKIVNDETSRKNNVQKAYSAIDKAAKKGIIHKNKAARLKSQAARAMKNQ